MSSAQRVDDWVMRSIRLCQHQSIRDRITGPVVTNERGRFVCALPAMLSGANHAAMARTVNDGGREEDVARI